MKTETKIIIGHWDPKGTDYKKLFLQNNFPNSKDQIFFLNDEKEIIEKARSIKNCMVLVDYEWGGEIATKIKSVNSTARVYQVDCITTDKYHETFDGIVSGNSEILLLEKTLGIKSDLEKIFFNTSRGEKFFVRRKAPILLDKSFTKMFTRIVGWVNERLLFVNQDTFFFQFAVQGHEDNDIGEVAREGTNKYILDGISLYSIQGYEGLFAKIQSPEINSSLKGLLGNFGRVNYIQRRYDKLEDFSMENIPDWFKNDQWVKKNKENIFVILICGLIRYTKIYLAAQQSEFKQEDLMVSEMFTEASKKEIDIDYVELINRMRTLTGNDLKRVKGLLEKFKLEFKDHLFLFKVKFYMGHKIIE
jgi:hypothetical protein